MQTTCAVKRPEIELPVDFRAAGFAGGFVGDFFALAEKIFLLRLVEIFQRQRGGFDVKNQFGHAAGAGGRNNQEGKPVTRTRLSILVIATLLLLLALFCFFLAATKITSDQFGFWIHETD